MIIVKNLTKNYGKIKALKNVNFTFENSKVIAIMGENGAGKSTLLKICAGVLPFDSGEVTIDGFSIVKDSIKAREQMGYLPEMPELYDRLTGREFLIYIASLRNVETADKKIDEITKMLGIYGSLDYELGSYSKGMKQKISLTSAMMHSPNNLLLDEPVYGLDPLTSRTIQDYIKNKKGSTIIATHSTQLVEQVADFVYLLMKGQVIMFDEVEKLMSKFGSMENVYFHYKDEKCLKQQK
ncbi:MAG: ABC transporter ATP-binding protein [Candidatus Thermoplasmatota archaeon]|nr:ABC transporter ATP-binding protein [Candidatus Thermoplasmatota archaeon]